MRVISALTIASLCIAPAANALPTKSELENKSTSLTIYSKAGPGSVPTYQYRPTPYNQGWRDGSSVPGYAVIRQEKDIYLQQKRSLLKLDDVAAYIDPTSVSFKSLTAPKSTSAIEQNFYFDLVSPTKLAERYLGQNITFEKTYQHKDPEIFTGTLLSAQNNQLTLQKPSGEVVFSTINKATFPQLPGGLHTKPTLALDVVSKELGKHRIETSYQTEGITWWADYNAVYSDGADENSGILDLGAWVSIVNKSGVTYDDAKLKLIAGDVNKVQPNRHQPQRMYKSMAMDSMEMVGGSGFAEKKFFEFHLYTLGRPTSLPDNSTKQIELFENVSNIPVEKLLVYNGSNTQYHGGYNTNANFGMTSNKKVEVYLRFKNEKETGMGMPLPAGKLRVSKRDDADGSMEFIGEDIIDHTPRNEEIKIKLGNAFDVVGERKQTNFRTENKRRYMTETISITVRNQKDKPVDVIITEPLSRAMNWKITNTNTNYDKIDARTVHFPVSIKPEGSKTVTYTVEYTW
jgi:hypothetical protein